MIIIRKDNSKEKKEEIDIKLSEFNREKCKWLNDKFTITNDEYREKEINFLVYDEDKLIGGAIGYIKYDWYFLDLLYIDENYRRQDIGTKLIDSIENLAKNEDLTGIRTETWDFQAKDFYLKNGFIVYAKIEDCPPGTTDYSLKKVFKN